MTQKPPRKICKTVFRPMLCSYPAGQIDVAEAHSKMVEFAYGDEWDGLTRSYGEIVVLHAYAILYRSLADLVCRLRDGERVRSEAGWKIELAKDVVPNEIHFTLRHDEHPGAWMISQRQMQCPTHEVQQEFDARRAAIQFLCPKPEYFKAMEAIFAELGGGEEDEGMEVHRLPQNYRRCQPEDPVQSFVIRALRVEEGKSKGRPVGHQSTKDYMLMKKAPPVYKPRDKLSADALCNMNGFQKSYEKSTPLPSFPKDLVMHPASTLEVLKVLSGILVDNDYGEKIREAAASYLDCEWIQPKGKGGEIVIDAAISSVHAAEGLVTQEVVDRAADVEMAKRAGAVKIKAEDLRVFPWRLKKAGHVSREKAYFPAQWRYWAEEVDGRLCVRAEVDEALADYRLRIQDAFAFERVDEVIPGQLGAFSQDEDGVRDATPKCARSDAARRTHDFWQAFQIFAWGTLMLEGDSPSKREDYLLKRIKEQDERRKKALS